MAQVIRNIFERFSRNRGSLAPAKRQSQIALLLLAILLGATALLASNHHRTRQHRSGQPGAFDYYVLALSWSPEFCHSHPSKPECASGKFGFVVHGLWPQYASGYPENCSTAPGLSDPSRMADIMPDAGLVAHEWKTHGTCSGLDADAYFQLVRHAFESVKIPARLARPRQMFSITPRELQADVLHHSAGTERGVRKGESAA